MEDDFFDLGGHSLLASQLIIHCKDYLNVDLSIRDIFENSKMFDMCNLVNQLINQTLNVNNDNSEIVL